jgi:phospholipid transport system substrate-binding protein
MRRLIIGALALSLSLHLSLGPARAQMNRPTEDVKRVIDEVLSILQDPELKSPAQQERRLDLIKGAINRRFDYGEMAKRSLGDQWRRLSPPQRTEFVGLFSDLLEASYANKFDMYTSERIVYQPGIVEEDYAEVRTVILRENDRIPINFRLLKEPEGWMIYDVVIEGVSLVSNYRSQFRRIIQESSYAELVRRLQAQAKANRAS